MAIGDQLIVQRDCEATLVPMGTAVYLPKGSEVVITQEQGETLTVQVKGNLVCIQANNRDALGLQPVSQQTPDVDAPQATLEDVWEALGHCYDPEIPVNIVELGLIYDVSLSEVEEGLRVDIRMTLTAAGCGMGPFIVDDVRAKTLALSGVCDVEVDLVFDPAWDRSMMSETAKLELGMF